MDYGRSGPFRSFGSFGPTHQQPEGRSVTVDWTMILALLVTIALVGYLAIALLLPEKFS
jgi:K+-transporting ATPase KdpF subunit